MIFTEKLSWLKFKDYVTLLNAVTGFVAIVLFLKGFFDAGMALVVAAVLLDFFDGKIARLLFGKDESNAFGRELDSLADAISFGAAPAALIISMHGTDGIIPLSVGAFFLCAGVTRLALFNLQTPKEKGTYTGVAIPVAALVVLGAHAFLFQYSLVVSVLAAFAMLSGFKYSKIGLKKATRLPVVFD